MRSIRIWMVAIVLPVLLIGGFTPLKAQTFAEWFAQKKTQKKYLLEQIAALKLYAGYVKKGYQVVDGGLETIRNITHGEFKLHEAFVTGLKKVSPVIARDARVAEIVTLQLGIVKAFGGIRGSDALSADQLVYLSEVADGVISECLTDLEELLLVVTSGKVEMTDDERLKRVDAVYHRMLDKSAFSQNFCSDVRLLIRQKQLEWRSIENLRRYYEIE